MVFNSDTNLIEPFGGVVDFLDRKNCYRRRNVGNRHLYIVFFDILAMNGESFLNYPLEKRRELLESIITPVHEYVPFLIV